MIAKQYRVSVVTVRNAVSGLAEKGLIERKQGKGTFVANSKFTKDMKIIQSFSQRCLHMGIRPGGRMLSNRLVPADEKMREQLEVENDNFLVFLSRLRSADVVDVSEKWIELCRATDSEARLMGLTQGGSAAIHKK